MFELKWVIILNENIKVINIETKVKILEKFDKGESRSSIL